jgi:geranylgeranyl diphosphate synthase type I
VSTAAPAQEFVALVEQQLEAGIARRLHDLSGYSFPALLGLEGLRRTHRGSSLAASRLLGVSYEAHGGEQAAGALPRRRMALIAGALELFTDASLAHGDLIAQSDIRRGQAALHHHFADLHQQSDWDGEAARMGRALASLTGDALISLAGDLFQEAIQDAADPQRAYMTHLRQVTQLERLLGQGMDAVYPPLPENGDAEPVIARALATVQAKTARHLVGAPLALGAAGAGAAPPVCDAMVEMGLHLGAAYQLHHDVQGALGDPQVTGKPAGQDLIDGKRTVLIGLTMRLLGPQEGRALSNALLRGNAPPVEARVEHLQGVIRRSGALEAVEVMIADRRRRALECLDAAPVSPAGRAALAEVSDWLLTSPRM